MESGGRALVCVELLCSLFPVASMPRKFLCSVKCALYGLSHMPINKYKYSLSENRVDSKYIHILNVVMYFSF